MQFVSLWAVYLILFSLSRTSLATIRYENRNLNGQCIRIIIQYWRLISHQLAFSNSADFFLAQLLLYSVGRHVERQFGSVKYAASLPIKLLVKSDDLHWLQSFIFVSLLLATLLQFITVILFYRVGVNHIALGPMAIIFSMLYQYSRIVPPVYIYRIFGIAFNNKSTSYILALQVHTLFQPNRKILRFCFTACH